ncbi:MAG: hypothetical protein ABSH41_26190 [Syntrophobacteraceae bacterium]
MMKPDKLVYFINRKMAREKILKGWTQAEFDMQVRMELEALGFDLSSMIRRTYHPITGDVVLWQEATDVRFPYSIN